MKLFTFSLLLALYLLGVASAVAQRIQIQSAVYGKGGYTADVTRTVQRYADRGQPFVVSNDNFRVDPLPGQRKMLSVVYYSAGRRFTERVLEGETFYFRTGGWPGSPRPPGPPGPPPWNGGDATFGIVKAMYGTDGRYVDVTGTVRSLANSGVRFKVSNETFGGDPYVGRRKNLKVTSIRDGQRVERQWNRATPSGFSSVGKSSCFPGMSVGRTSCEPVGCESNALEIGSDERLD